MSTVTDISDIIKPALDAYGVEIARHGQASTGEALRAYLADEMTYEEYHAIPAQCRCGWTPAARIPERNKRRSIGLHVAAATKRASKVYDEESSRLLDEAYGRA